MPVLQRLTINLELWAYQPQQLICTWLPVHFGDGSGATDHLYLQISGSGAGPKVSAQVFKDGKALNSTAGVVVGKVLNGGDGDYTVTVNKSAAGNATYGISFHCQSKSGGHTDTTIRQFLPDQ